MALTPPSAGVDGVAIHSSRHTAIIRLVRSGVSLAAVQKFAGHRHVSATMKYTHVLGTWEGHSIGTVGRRPLRPDDPSEPREAVLIELLPRRDVTRTCSGCGRQCSSIHDVEQRWVRDLPIFESQIDAVHRAAEEAARDVRGPEGDPRGAGQLHDPHEQADAGVGAGARREVTLPLLAAVQPGRQPDRTEVVARDARERDGEPSVRDDRRTVPRRVDEERSVNRMYLRPRSSVVIGPHER
jgi:hypothetical protein